jgi:probable phosphoglycerate mutase
VVQAVQVYASVAVREGRATFGVVIRDVDGQLLRVAGRALGDATDEVAAYRAVLHGVWRAKRLGARRVRVFTEHPEVVAHLAGRSEVPPDLVGLYLQTKAMLNAYRWSRVEVIAREQNAEAARAAAEAFESDAVPAGAPEDDDVDVLPLWRSAEDAPAGARR